jgi:hypothetical protein
VVLSNSTANSWTEVTVCTRDVVVPAEKESVGMRLSSNAPAMPWLSDWRPSRPHVKLMSSRNCGREFHARKIHTVSAISTVHNFQEAAFRHKLRSNITSSEEQSSSRRERNRGRPENRQRNSGWRRGSFCSGRNNGSAKDARGDSWLPSKFGITMLRSGCRTRSSKNQTHRAASREGCRPFALVPHHNGLPTLQICI